MLYSCTHTTTVGVKRLIKQQGIAVSASAFQVSWTLWVSTENVSCWVVATLQHPISCCSYGSSSL